MKTKVLIIGDSLTLQERLLHTLAAEEFRTFASSTGPAAIFQYYLVQPDLIVLDGRSNGPAGAEVLQRIRERGSTPVIVLLDQDDALTRIKYLDRGADYCMLESFDGLELQAGMRALLRRARQVTQKRSKPTLAYEHRAGTLEAM